MPGEDFGEVNNVRGEEILSEIGDPQRGSSTALIAAVWLNSFGLIAKYRRGAATCTGIIAVVFGVIAASILSGSMFPVAGSISTKTGLMPFHHKA